MDGGGGNGEGVAAVSRTAARPVPRAIAARRQDERVPAPASR